MVTSVYPTSRNSINSLNPSSVLVNLSYDGKPRNSVKLEVFKTIRNDPRGLLNTGQDVNNMKHTCVDYDDKKVETFELWPNRKLTDDLN